MRVLGVDPGLSGAMSIVAPDAGHGFKWVGIDMPKCDTGVDVIRVDEFIARYKPDYAFIEAVTGRRGEGQQHAFNFGGACFAVRTVIELRRIPYRLIGPVAWKNYHGLTRVRTAEQRAAEDADRSLQAAARRDAKTRSRLKAAELVGPEDARLFDKVKSDNLAESLLIAVYGLSRARP